MSIAILDRLIKGSPSGDIDADLLRINDDHFVINANKQLEFHADQLAGNAVAWARDGNNDLIPIDKLGNVVVNDVRSGTAASATQAPSEAATRSELDALSTRIDNYTAQRGISDTIALASNATAGEDTGDWSTVTWNDWSLINLTQAMEHDMVIAIECAEDASHNDESVVRFLAQELMDKAAYPTGWTQNGTAHLDCMIFPLPGNNRLAIARGANNSQVNILVSSGDYGTVDIKGWHVYGQPGPQGPRGHDGNVTNGTLGDQSNQSTSAAPTQAAVINYVREKSDNLTYFLPDAQASFDNPYEVLHGDGARLVWQHSGHSHLGGYTIGDWKMIYVSWRVVKSDSASESYSYTPKFGGEWFIPADIPDQEASDNDHGGPVRVYDNRDFGRYFEFVQSAFGILTVTGQHGFPNTDSINVTIDVRGIR